jgi:hypothetical protein
MITHGIEQTGLSSLRTFANHKQSNCKLIGDHPANPSDLVSRSRHTSLIFNPTQTNKPE